MSAINVLRCEKCQKAALVVHLDRPLCVECLMAEVSQSREQTKLMNEVKPLRFDELQGISPTRSPQLFR